MRGLDTLGEQIVLRCRMTAMRQYVRGLFCNVALSRWSARIVDIWPRMWPVTCTIASRTFVLYATCATLPSRNWAIPTRCVCRTKEAQERHQVGGYAAPALDRKRVQPSPTITSAIC